MKLYEERLKIQLKRINYYLKEYELQVNQKNGFFYSIEIVYKDKTGLYSTLMIGITVKEASDIIDCVEKIASLIDKQ